MPKKFTKEDFIEQLKKEHPDFELIGEYNGNKKPVIIKCKKHNYIFKTTPNRLHSGQGCQKCYDERRGKTQLKSQDDFIKEISEIYKFKNYSFSRVNYVNSNEKVCIICKKHGEFYVSPNHIITRHDGCPKCRNEENGKKKRLSIEEFVRRSEEVNGKKYDYSNVKYKSVDNDVEIICPIHGSFFQTPYTHMKGAGCPKCNESKLEKYTEAALINLGINYIPQKKFDWLGLQSLDFYLPDFKMAIECQGGQHFRPVKHFGGDIAFETCVKRDILKNELCKKHNIKILYVKDSYMKYNTRQEIFENIYKKIITKEKLKDKLSSICVKKLR